jgi:hypothetical protein
MQPKADAAAPAPSRRFRRGVVAAEKSMAAHFRGDLICIKEYLTDSKQAKGLHTYAWF